MSSSKISSVRKALAKNIVRIRKGKFSPGGKPWTQAKLASLCGVSLGTIQKVETGNSWPDWKTVLKISEALDVCVDTLYVQQISLDLEEVLAIVNKHSNISLKPARKTLEMDKDFFMESLKHEVDQVAKVLPSEIHQALEGLVEKVIEAVG